jgi:hypothetical protein
VATPICMSKGGWHGVLLYHGGQHDMSNCGRHNVFIPAPIDNMVWTVGKVSECRMFFND